MKPLLFSFIVPVYNRPDELRELLQSMAGLEGDPKFEVVVIEDGSTIPASDEVERFREQLDITYLQIPNGGPGNARNHGMKQARGNYFIVLDSDCILPEHYLVAVSKALEQRFTHVFGGPDRAHSDFSNLQKAIDVAMTSVLTTGGIRGHQRFKKGYQPRSFNMGISQEAFERSGGFGRIHPGEDPDLSLRLEKLGYHPQFIADAYVFHKRRISWSKFLKQVYKFGKARPIISRWHPESRHLKYWFPTCFSLGFVVAAVLAALQMPVMLWCYGVYFLILFVHALYRTRNFMVAVQSIVAVLIQFFGYGTGFVAASVKLVLSRRSAEHIFPSMFKYPGTDAL